MSSAEPFVGPGPAEGPVVLDERTLHILERRRSSAVRVRRGWLVRRMLVVADLVGLTLAFLAATFVFGETARRIPASSVTGCDGVPW